MVNVQKFLTLYSVLYFLHFFWGRLFHKIFGGFADSADPHLGHHCLHMLSEKVSVWNFRTVTVLRHFISTILTLKTARKLVSENVVCLCRLLNILANFSNLFLHTGKQCGPRSDCS